MTNLLNILLIIIKSLKADYVSIVKVIRKLSREGIYFIEAVSNACYTNSSIRVLFSLLVFLS